MGPRAGLDRCRKSRPHWDSIAGPSSLQPVVITTMIPDPLVRIYYLNIQGCYSHSPLNDSLIPYIIRYKLVTDDFLCT